MQLIELPNKEINKLKYVYGNSEVVVKLKNNRVYSRFTDNLIHSYITGHFQDKLLETLVFDMVSELTNHIDNTILDSIFNLSPISKFEYKI